jgi:hypothetical protein
LVLAKRSQNHYSFQCSFVVNEVHGRTSNRVRAKGTSLLHRQLRLDAVQRLDLVKRDGFCRTLCRSNDSNTKCNDCLGPNPRIRFVIAGDGPLKNDFISRYGHLANVHFLPLQPEEALCEPLNVADQSRRLALRLVEGRYPDPQSGSVVIVVLPRRQHARGMRRPLPPHKGSEAPALGKARAP